MTWLDFWANPSTRLLVIFQYIITSQLYIYIYITICFWFIPPLQVPSFHLFIGYIPIVQILPGSISIPKIYIYIYAHVWWLEPTSQVHAYFSGLNHVKCLFLWGLSALTTKGSVIPRTLGKLHGQCLGRRLSLRLAQADGADGEVGKLSNHSRGIE